MARLFVAHQIASAANVEIMARKLEACAQTVEVAQYLQALFRCLGQHPIGFMGEIGISAGLRSAYAPAQLI